MPWRLQYPGRIDPLPPVQVAPPQPDLLSLLPERFWPETWLGDTQETSGQPATSPAKGLEDLVGSQAASWPEGWLGQSQEVHVQAPIAPAPGRGEDLAAPAYRQWPEAWLGDTQETSGQPATPPAKGLEDLVGGQAASWPEGWLGQSQEVHIQELLPPPPAVLRIRIPFHLRTTPDMRWILNTRESMIFLVDLKQEISFIS